MQIIVNVPEVLPENMIQRLLTQFEQCLEEEAEHWLKEQNVRKEPDIYKSLKLKILEEYPELQQRTPQEIRESFEKVSRKIAEHMPYQTVEEFVKAMRRETSYEMPS